MHRLVATLFVAVVAATPARAIAFQRERIVVTFDNRAAAHVATADANVAMVAALRARGYDVVSGEKVEAFLRDQGIPSVAKLPPERLARLIQQFRVPSILEVTVEFLLPPAKRKLGPEAQPIIGLSGIRYGADGLRTWRATTTVVGDEVMSRGKGREAAAPITRIMLSAGCDKLLWSLPSAAPDPELVRLAASQRAKEKRKITIPVATNVPPRIETLLEHRPDFRTGPRFRLKVQRRGPIPADGEPFPPDPGASRPPAENPAFPTATGPRPPPPESPASPTATAPAPPPALGPATTQTSIVPDLVAPSSSGRMSELPTK